MPKSKPRASHIRRMLRPAGARGARRWDTLAEAPAGARFRRSKLAWLGLGLALLLGLYALLGFLLAPRVLRTRMIDFVQAEYGRRLTVGEVRVHPFKLYAEVRDLALPDADGSPLIRLRRVFVDLQGPASLWERAYVFRQIVLERPQLALELRPDGSFNLADLGAQNGPRSRRDSRVSIWIQSLAIERGRVNFRDRARAAPFERRFDPLSITLRDFRTASEGTFGCSVRTDDGAQLEWRGVAGLRPQLASSGRFALSNLSLPRLVEYAPGVLPLHVARGQLALSGTYALKQHGGFRLGLALSRVAVRDLVLRAHNGGAELALSGLVVAGADIRVPENTVDVAQLTVTGLTTEARREPDGTLNLTRLLAAKSAGQAPASPPTAAWSLKLRKLDLVAAVIDLEDQTVSPPFASRLAPVHLSLQDLTLDPSRALPFTVSVGLEGGGGVHAQGRLVPSPFAASVDLRVDRLALGLAQPYLSPHAKLSIDDGQLDAVGKLTVVAATPALSFAGDVTIDALKTRDLTHRDLLAFERLQLEHVSYRLAPGALRVERVTLLRPQARIVLDPRGVLNLAEVFATTPKRAGAREAAEPAPDQTFALQVGTVSIEDMRVQFSDQVIEPNFSADIQGLRGAVRGLSSDPRSRASLALDGEVGRNAPVSITGTLRPFAFDRHTDIRLRCENIALPLFNPYSGRFAGYSIERGELTTDIHYELHNRKLEAAHAIRIDQLAWGEATHSKAKAPLPVKLATALLRDRNGVISLDLPLGGSLDDPSFRVWPLVWQVLKNVVVKAASAPFDLLGSLFRGAERAKVIDFAPGVGEPSATASAALRILAQAMAERPALRLEIPPGVLPTIDRPALAAHKYEQLVAAALRRRQRGGDHGAPPNLAALDVEDWLELVAKVFEQLTGDEPELPEVPPPDHDLTRKEAKAARRASELEQLERATRAAIPIADDELAALGRQRAEAIEAVLLEGGKVDASRVLISRSKRVRDERGKVQLELQLE